MVMANPSDLGHGKNDMVGPVDNGPSTNYRVVHLTGTPQIFLSIGSHVNWTGMSLSVNSNKGSLYLENLGGFH